MHYGKYAFSAVSLILILISGSLTLTMLTTYRMDDPALRQRETFLVSLDKEMDFLRMTLGK